MRPLWLLALVVACSCVPVRRMPLSKSADAARDEVQVHVSSVSASNAFLSQRGGGPSVLAVTATVTSSSEAAVLVDLDRATLVITDPGADKEHAELVLEAWTSGRGEAPDAIPPDRHVGQTPLWRGQVTTFWVAFQAKAPLPESDIPRRIVMRVPMSGGGPPLEITLADPATGRPRWVHPPIEHASYAGVSVLGTPFDEGSFGILRTSWKNAAGRVIFGPSASIGVRGGELRGERERTIACCDLGLSFDVSVNTFGNLDNSVGPYVSYQGVFVLEDGRRDHAAWHGPAVGLQFHNKLIEPIVARGLPVRPTPSPLGYSSFTIAYAHLFRRGDPGGSPGMLLLFEHTLPEW